MPSRESTARWLFGVIGTLVGAGLALLGTIYAAHEGLLSITRQINATNAAALTARRSDAEAAYLTAVAQQESRVIDLHDTGQTNDQPLDLQLDSYWGEVVAKEKTVELFATSHVFDVVLSPECKSQIGAVPLLTWQVKCDLDNFHRAARRDPNTDYRGTLMKLDQDVKALLSKSRGEVAPG